MKVAPQIVRQYYKTIRRYRKLFARIHRESISAYEKKTFIAKLRKLFRQLRQLEGQIKIAAATGTVVLMLHSAPSNAQTSTLGPFVSHDRGSNPLREPLFTGNEPILAVADIDGDGDRDIIVGERDSFYGGYLRYFENQTAQGQSIYLEKQDEENPFDGIHAISRGVAPGFADFDSDGDLDLFLGQNEDEAFYSTEVVTQTIEYYRNDAGNYTKQTGPWNETTKQGNPFNGTSLGWETRPVAVDFDKDGDMDVVAASYRLLGSYPNYIYEFIHLFKNNGKGTLVRSTLNISPNPVGWSSLTPALADVDADGDFDLTLGSYYYDHLLFYKQQPDGSFAEQSGPWNPVAKTGNPFHEFEVGSNAAPAFIDFNGDGQLDLFVADEQGYNKYSDNIINYYKNNGNSAFEEVDGFDNPFDGVFVKRFASPVMMDVDGDQELDALIGNKYTSWEYDYSGTRVYTYSQIAYYKKNDGAFEEPDEDEDPFKDLQVDGHFIPSFGDVDGDSDDDMISGAHNGGVYYFQNNNGVYTLAGRVNPFANINVMYQGAGNLVDIDNDGDLDLFMSNGYREFYYYINSGTAKVPSYTPQTGVNNPLENASALASGYTPHLHFSDLDHDGDLDVIFPGVSQSQRVGEILYLENTGTKEKPVFDKMFNDFLPGADTRSPRVFFADHDNDGDLDSFVGNYDGTVSYLENQNPAVITTVSGGAVNFEPGDPPVIVDAGLVLSDPDNDFIVRATVTIQDFRPNKLLKFTPVQGISGVFDTSTGILTFSGKATVKVYQDLLRKVTFETVADAGRTRSDEAIKPQIINFAVYDEDFTNASVASKTLDVFEYESGVFIYNAVAPNSSGDNRLMRVTGLPKGNKVTIFSRWGDKVFEADDYVNTPAKAFRGLTTSGDILPTGTYFYVIEMPGRKTLTGYLILKQ